MGRMESEMMYHYADLSPASSVDPALFFKADRAIVVWFFGDSLFLEYVPTVPGRKRVKSSSRKPTLSATGPRTM